MRLFCIRFRSNMMKEVVCAIDVGSWTFKVCAYDWKTFEILTNEANFRETPSVISFTHSQRLIGEEAANKLKSNYANTIRSPLRLIGLENDFQLIEQELKDCTAKFEIDNDLIFLVGQKRTRVQPEELLIALFGKVRKILAEHHMTAEFVYVTVPSYLSQHERRIIKRCAEISEAGQQARIVDDWVSISSEYSFTRVKELNSSISPRLVLFVDVGYSKTSLFVVEFGSTESRLLDCQHLRYVGARNMDHLMTEYYDRLFRGQINSQQSLFSMPKNLVKLKDHIEKQRRVLSANTEHHLHVESLLDDNDLSYNIKRTEFEALVAPVLAQIGKGMRALKGRMPEKLRLHSVELLGGASRIPALRTLIYDVYGLEPSKTLNQSEAMAHGTAVYGAKEAGLFFYDYSVININLVEILACWNYTSNGVFLGEGESEYKYRQVVFGCNCKVPGQNVLSFGNEGPIEMFLYYGQNISKKSIAYVRFNTPNRIRFTLDNSKIVKAHLDSGSFIVCKFYERKEERWAELRAREHELVMHQQRLRRIYQLKNLYQAKLYSFKNKMDEYREVMNEPQSQFVDQELKRIQDWIQSEHTRPLGSEDDIHLYTLKIQEISSTPIFENLQVRKRNIASLLEKYNIVKRDAEAASIATKNEVQARRLHFLMRWLLESYESMKMTHWEGYYLTETSLDFAAAEIGRILTM